MFDLGNMLEAGIASAVLNVVAVIAIVCLGAFIIVFLCDLILSISGNKNGIFFKRKENIYEQQQVETREQNNDLSIYDERISALEEKQNSFDMEKAEQEERELREKVAFDRERELEVAEEKEREQDNRISDLEARNAELLKLLEEKDEEKEQVVQETEEEQHDNGVSLLDEIQEEEDDYDDIIAAINKMREEESMIVEETVDNGAEEETVQLDEDEDEETIIFDELEVEDEDIVQPTVEEVAVANSVRDDEYYKTLSAEIADLKKELEEQKRIMEQDKLEAKEREDALRKENEQLAVELEGAKQTQEIVEITPVMLTEQEYLDRLEVLRERQKENDKQLRKIKKEYKPLERVYRTLERDREKLRRREAIVAKQKILLYGVNNYIDIDEEKAQKLAEDLDLLDGLRLSVQHCEEVISENKDRYPILEQTYNILVTNSEQIAGDIKQLEDDLARLKASQDTGDEDAHQEPVAETENVEDVVVNATAEDSVEEPVEDVTAETPNTEVVVDDTAEVELKDGENAEKVEDVLENQISIDDVQEDANKEETADGEDSGDENK